MALNIQPGAGFMQRMLGATNAIGQQMGGPFGQASRLTAGMNQNRINRQPMPSRATTPNTGMMPSGLPNPNMGGRFNSPGMPMSNGGQQPQPTQPTMPIVQGPSSMPSVGQLTGGNTGITGGMNFGGMGGFPRPQVDTGNMVNDNQMFAAGDNPSGGGIWNRYQTMQRPEQRMFL